LKHYQAFVRIILSTVGRPGNERRPGVRHNSLFRVNVFLLPRVDNVFLFKALERERPTSITQQCDLHNTFAITAETKTNLTQPGWQLWLAVKTVYFHFISLVHGEL